MPSIDRAADDVRLRGPRAAAVARRAYADGFARKVGPVAEELVAEGLSLRRIACELNRRGFAGAMGAPFSPQSVKNLLDRNIHTKDLTRRRQTTPNR